MKSVSNASTVLLAAAFMLTSTLSAQESATVTVRMKEDGKVVKKKVKKEEQDK